MLETYSVPAELLARCVGRVDLAQRVVGAFVAQLEEDIPGLSSELESGNTDAACKIAHRLKGASANVAAEELRAVAERIETSTRDGDMKAAEQTLPALLDAWQEYKTTTESFLSVEQQG